MTTLGLAAAILAAPPAWAVSAPALRASPIVDCSALAGADFSHVRDAPSVVVSAAVATSGGHAYCDVRGSISPRTHFDIKLPTSGWRGQYLQEGCDGGVFCGAVALPARPLAGFTCQPAVDGQLVLATDDGGHTASDQTDGRWAKNDPHLRQVFGLTSEHSLKQLAKAVITRYYGRPPAYSYFDGCSTGGRQGLILAQRYPTDFDGIIAGAPAGNLAPLAGMLDPWLIQHNTDRAGHQILTAEKLAALHAAVIGQCGDAHGIIADPRRCTFQPASIQCPPGTDTAPCLTTAQVSAVRAFYRGPTDTAGGSLYNGGVPYGSELGWATFVAPAADTGAPADTYDARIALNYLKYLGYAHNPPDRFTLAGVRFTDRELARLNVLGNAIYNANNPDLTAFRAHGGKLLIYHGLADPAIPPWSTIDYYAAVEHATGGFAASQRFSRLYLVPGAYHCLVGPDFNHPAEIATPELLTPMIAWVERGVAPQAVPAPIIALPDYATVIKQTIAPYDALAPAPAAATSLNGNYDYHGHYPPRPS